MNLWQKVADAAVAATEAANGSLSAALQRLAGRDAEQREPQHDVRFTIALIALCAKVARSDGAVTHDEVEAFQRIVHIEPEDEAHVRRVFDLAKQDVAGFEEYARQVARLFANHLELRRDVLEGLFVIAAADSVLHENEEAFLETAGRLLQLEESERQHIRSLFIRGGTSPYQVLGLSPSASDAELKARHRKLVLEHHPDRMRGDGVPDELIVIAERKLAAINAAFDVIARERGL